MWPFKYTSGEPGLWRGWLKDGQSVELSWQRRGWAFGAGVHIHSNDDDMGDRLLFLKFWRGTAVIPLGIVPHPWPPFDGPQWSAYASREFGLTVNWGMRRWSLDWPFFTLMTRAWEYELDDGTWWSVDRADELRGEEWEARPRAKTETHPYTYTLRSGHVQSVTATIHRERFTLSRKWFGWLPWLDKRLNTIDVRFSDEVGERAGSWKGGCIGCGYDMRPGETPLDTLRRMERERKFG